MYFELKQHGFDFSGRYLSLRQWPSGQQTARIIAGSPANIQQAKALALKLLESHERYPDNYFVPISER